jgi:hypothetical protein
MFLFPAADIQDDNGTVALFAEDFNFASFWQIDPDGRVEMDEYEANQVFKTCESYAPVF